jgi:hypothetical protein
MMEGCGRKKLLTLWGQKTEKDQEALGTGFAFQKHAPSDPPLSKRAHLVSLHHLP